MARLIYSAITSLDGFITDESGSFDWAAPDEEVHTFFNDLERDVGTYLYGREMYDVMAWWETEDLSDQPGYIQEYADIWRARDKVVYSTTLDSPKTARTRIEREFDPDAVREMKAGAERDIAIGGSNLAAQVIRAGLVDEYQLVVAPIVVGGGKPAIPDGVRFELELLDERRFTHGMVYLRYRARQ